MEKIGFIGLGVMGRPMVANLAASGEELLVNDIIFKTAEEVARDFGVTAASLGHIAENCSVVFTMVTNGEAAREVITGEHGLLPNLREGSIVVDMSSVSPQDSKYCAQRLVAKGVEFLDAPVSGGEEGAIRGSLAIMAGGKPETYQRVKKYFDILGSKSVLVGGTGSGSITKLVNQIIVNLNIAALSEAMVFAKKAGVDPEKAFSAIRSGLAGSQVMEDKAPRMLSRNFAPGARISINHKDLANALATARELDIPMPMSAMLFETMQYLKLHDHFDEDHAAILRYFENMAGIDFL